MRAVEGNAPIRSRMGLSKEVGAWSLRVCVCACGGLAAIFVLAMILAVIFARPAAAAQLASGSRGAFPGRSGPVLASGGRTSPVFVNRALDGPVLSGSGGWRRGVLDGVDRGNSGGVDCLVDGFVGDGGRNVVGQSDRRERDRRPDDAGRHARADRFRAQHSGRQRSLG